MGKYKLRLSEMIPNAWFYKLKDMSRLRNEKQQQQQKKGTNPTTIRKLAKNTTSSSSISLSSSSSVAAPNEGLQRKSYYFSRDLITKTKSSVSDKTTPQVPRKSSRRRRSSPRPRIVNSSSSISAGCRATIESVWTKQQPPADDHINNSCSSSDHDSMLTEFGSETPADTSCKCCRGHKNSKDHGDNKVVLNLMSNGTDHNGELFNHHPYHDLPPIITNNKLMDRSRKASSYGSSLLSVTVVKEDFSLRSTHQLQTTDDDDDDWTNSTSTNVIRRNQHHKTTTTSTVAKKKNIKQQQQQQRLGIISRPSAAGGVKLRTNSPRIANRRRKTNSRVSDQTSTTFAVVKTSTDPRRDFTDSMMEMILENNITASQDLEDLLACYLSLNSHHYHHLIINVFKQIWFHYLHHLPLP